MSFICELSPIQLQNLIDDSVFKTLKNEDLNSQESVEWFCVLSNLAIALVTSDIDEMKKYLSKTKIEKDKITKFRILKKFLQFHSEWMIEECEDCKYSVNFDIDFFEFDSEDIDESIKQMHYLDENKIDAKTFLSNNSIDYDVIDTIKNSIDILDEMFENEQFELKDIIIYLSKFIELEYVDEFKDIGYNVEKLLAKLYDIQEKNLDEKQKEVLFQFLGAVIEDLKKWVDEVFISQTTTDIHYLDASLLANIAQLEIVLDNLKEK